MWNVSEILEDCTMNEWKLEKLVFKGYAMNEKLGEKVTNLNNEWKLGEKIRMKNWGERLPNGWKFT
jgi:hypothetical protein